MKSLSGIAVPVALMLEKWCWELNIIQVYFFYSLFTISLMHAIYFLANTILYSLTLVHWMRWDKGLMSWSRTLVS